MIFSFHSISIFVFSFYFPPKFFFSSIRARSKFIKLLSSRSSSALKIQTALRASRVQRLLKHIDRTSENSKNKPDLTEIIPQLSSPTPPPRVPVPDLVEIRKRDSVRPLKEILEVEKGRVEKEIAMAQFLLGNWAPDLKLVSLSLSLALSLSLFSCFHFGTSSRKYILDFL